VKKPPPPDGYTIEPLDTSLHLRDGFSCGEQALDRYLMSQASQAQEKLVSGTHVLLETEKAHESRRPIVGFLSLTTTSIPLVECPQQFKRLTNRDAISVMLLARMAVHKDHQSRGLGIFLLRYAFACTIVQAEISGCPAIIVDAKDAARAFYLKFGFTAFPERPNRLFLATATLKQLVASVELP
jgi:GNAT superfamily N-acetyltransferase